jgi:spore coat protein U-like protein
VVLAKSTTALTCLLGLLIILRTPAQSATATGSMGVSTIVLSGSGGLGGGGSSCSVSASNMTFAVYTGSSITATSAVSVNCTNNTSYSISFNDTPEANPSYYLVLSGGSSANLVQRLNVTFLNGSETMTNGGATIIGTGIGSSVTAGTITGTIDAGQTGKTAGSYSKIMTLNIVYNSSSPS